VAFASTPDDLREAITDGLAAASRVLVAWSFYSPDALAAFDELASTRVAVDDLRVTHLAGGVHASAEPERTLRAGFDLVAVGEGEATFVALVDALAHGAPLTDVHGLGSLDADGRYVSTGGAVRHELDAYPSFATRWGRFGPIEITRGCIYSCRFCQTPYLFKARFRHRSVDSIRAHVRELRTRGMRYVRFITPTSLSYGTQDETPELGAVDEMLGAVRDELGTDGKVYFGSFPSEVRPEHVTHEAMRILRRHVDNTSIIIGAQSGSDDVLASSKRGHGVEVVERAVRIALEHGFRPDVDFLFGLPGERDVDAAQSLAFAESLADLGARIHGHTFLPLPGTPYRNAEPGTVSASTRVGLDRLAARGRLYGQWAAQEQIAQQLVPLVRRERRR
jgi:B12-binding domain/radical SAM domain protein